MTVSPPHRAPTIENLLLLDPPGGEELQGLGQVFRRNLGSRATVHRVATRDELGRTLQSGFPYHLVVVDFARGDGSVPGEELLRVLRASHPDLPVVAVSTSGELDMVRRAIVSGATEFMVLDQDLELRVRTLLAKMEPLKGLLEDNENLREQSRRLLESEQERYRLIGQSPQIRRVAERVERVARIPRPVLVVGERGTGKELVARAIHAAAGDGRRPIVAVNCAAFSDALLESELFGHERGAFTGADRTVKGKFELANGGTLFLDEIGFMSLSFQQKILRVVEYGTFNRVGGREEIQTSARIIAATNVDLSQMMESGEFLRDLYDRLSFEVIEVPPLRERHGDVELLAQYFLAGFMREMPAFRGKSLSLEAIDALRAYDFPGNVRELKNIIERAAYRDTTYEISPRDLGLVAPPGPSPVARSEATTAGLPVSFKERVDAFKRRLVLDALAAADGNQTEAARMLDLTYHQFRYLYRRYRET